MRIRSSLAVLAAVLTFATVAHAKSPVQVMPDGLESTVLINKQVNNEQWVITLDTDNATLTGNVFDLTGKPPTFFFCDATFDDNFFELADLATENVTFDCQIASGCAALPCETEWHPIGGAPITLPGSFFLP
jgi:hypothetical protein